MNTFSEFGSQSLQFIFKAQFLAARADEQAFTVGGFTLNTELLVFLLIQNAHFWNSEKSFANILELGQIVHNTNNTLVPSDRSCCMFVRTDNT